MLSSLLNHLLKEKENRFIQPSILALLAFHLGDEAAAIVHMEDAMRLSDFGLKHIVSEPYWDNYREHPKVKDALKLVGMDKN